MKLPGRGKRLRITIAVFGVLILLGLGLIVGKIVGIPALGVTSVFQEPATCRACHEVWYDDATYAFNPAGNKQPPTGMTIGCAECHPVQFEEYELSSMGSSKNPLRPGCTNCHQHAHTAAAWFKHMYLADASWINMVQLALRDRALYNSKLSPELARKARARFIANDSARCRECHTRPDHLAMLKGTPGEYRADIPPHKDMQKEGLTCVQCHQNLTHNLSVPAPWEGKPTPAEQGDPIAGAQKAKLCSACHGVDGNSPAATFPSIAGLNANYIYLQLQAFKTGMRTNAVMPSFTAALSKKDMADISAYYAGKKMHPSRTRKKVLTLIERSNLERGETLFYQHCARCHGLTGRGQGIFPRLAGQYPEYDIAQLNAFKAGTRGKHSIMRDVATGLHPEDVKLIVDYLATLD